MGRRAAVIWLAGFLALFVGVPVPDALARAPLPQGPRADSSAAVDGAVVDAAGRGIAGVEVLVMDSKQLVRTNASGAYRIDSLEAGLHVLRFRRLGLRPVTLTVRAAPGDVTGVDVVMGPMVYRLATVEVQGANGDVFRIPKAFAARMSGPGQYLTEADIVKRHPLRTSDIFRGLAGLSVPLGAAAVMNHRGTAFAATGCAMPVYINGGTDVMATASSNSNGGTAPTISGSLGLETVDPTEIVGIEIYRGPSTMPAGLPASTCGAIVIWTK